MGIKQVSTGDIFRQNIQDGTELGKIADSYISKGNLVPDDITIDIVRDRLEKDDVKNGVNIRWISKNSSSSRSIRSNIS